MSDRSRLAEQAQALYNQLYGTGDHSHQDQPASLKDEAIQLLPEVKGNRAYLDRLDEAAKEMYRLIISNQSVQAYIDSGESVLRDDATRGKIKPFKPTDEPKIRKALAYILHSMAFVASHPSRKLTGTARNLRYVSIPLSDRSYTGKDSFPFSRDVMSQTCYALAAFEDEQGGWVCLHPGRHNDETGKGLITRLEPLAPMKDFLVRHQLVFAGHPEIKPRKQQPETGLIWVNVGDKEGDDADGSGVLPLNRDLTEAESILPLLNRKLVRQKLHLRLPDYASYERHWVFNTARSRLFIDSNRKTLFRQFRYEDGVAGRLYGHCVQTMPGEIRRHLEIDGQPVVEADYSSMQLAMLYADKGMPTPPGDLYDQCGGSRDAMKTVLTLSVGNPTKAETLQALRHRMQQDNRDPRKAERDYDRFWSVHEAVCPHDAEEAPWGRLQFIDSEIALRVLRLLFDQEIYAIPIHDSFIVKAKHRDALVDAMQLAWGERYPDTDIRIKVTEAQRDSQ